MLPVDPTVAPLSTASPLLHPGLPPNQSFEIRSFSAEDHSACSHLYTDGLLGGKLAENDTGFDIDDIASAYMKPGSHFWVAESDEKIVGMIGVQHHGDGVGEIRRLRVLEAFRRRGIGSGLVEAAVQFCSQQAYLKVTLDTFVDHEPAIKLFQKFHFHLSRTKRVGDRDLLYFYLDLYGGEKQSQT
jgi:ribosomal protein S18 acetylase RimI-like enzyme